MTRLFQIMFLSCVVASLAGCNAFKEDPPIWQHTKVTDLAPHLNGKPPASRLLKTIDFAVYIFEIPAENIGTLNKVWKTLYKKPLHFNDYAAFAAGSFSVGFGQIRMWNKVADVLRLAGAEKVETASLLLPDGQSEDLPIAELPNEKTIFYISAAGSMEGTTIGPGMLNLRIKAEKIPGSRGVCNVDVLPVFSPPTSSSIPQLAARTKSDEFFFTSVGFKLKMTPADFLFLGPQEYADNQTTLAASFFSRHRRKPVIRTYLIVCTGIND